VINTQFFVPQTEGVQTVERNNLEAGLNESYQTVVVPLNTDAFNNARTDFFIDISIIAGAVDQSGGVIAIDNIIVRSQGASGPTCNDGIQNGTETGVDCGGTCPDACPSGNVVTEFFLDFENGNEGFVTDAGLGAVADVDNPSGTGRNNSARVLQFTGVNNDQFANGQRLNPGGDVFDLSGADRGFSMLVRGPRNVPVKLKIEQADNFAIAQEVDANYTGNGEWQELLFDFSSFTEPTTLAKVVIFFDITGAPSGDPNDDIFFIDDLAFGEFNALSSDSFSLSEFSVTPNPAVDSWLIQGQEIISSVEVFDLLGKNVLSLAPNSLEVRLDASNLNTGLYLAKISSAQGSRTVKLVKD
jgi:hypothetical protein